jgi:hypothetical protein
MNDTSTLLENILTNLNNIPEKLLSFLSQYTSDNAYMPNGFLFTYELARIEYNTKYGYKTNNSP